MDGHATLPKSLLHALRRLLGERVSTAEAVRVHHGQDESYHPVLPPDAVAFPGSTDEVAEIVRLPKGAVPAMLARNEFEDAKTIVGLQAALARLG